MGRVKKVLADSVVSEETGASAPAPFSPDPVALVAALEKKAPGSRAGVLTKRTTVITNPRFMSTQHVGLDAILGGGIPAGRLIEIFSTSEGAGKSTLSAHIIAECQRTGGIAVLIDTEKGNTLARLEQLGVDVEKLIYADPPYIEKVFELLAGLMSEAKKGGFANRMLIVWDSIAATPTKAQFEAEYDEVAKMATLARALSTHLPKFATDLIDLETYFVTINQSRYNIGVMFGEKMTTSGGKAPKFWASVRLQLDVKTKIKSASGVVDGIIVRAITKKNKLAPPFRDVEINILFDRGMDTQRALYDFLVAEGVIQLTGAWNAISGVEKKFQYKDFDAVLASLPDSSVQEICRVLKARNITEQAIQRYFPEYPFG